MDWMACVDLSCSMLFEATADSEADSDINKNMDQALSREDTGSSEDDALSCSCDDSEFKEFDLSDANHEFDLVAEEEVFADDHNYKNVADDDEEDEEGAVNQLLNGSQKAKDLKRAGAAASRGVLIDQERQPKKRKVCADSVKEFMNERDNDRLFWETCLAS